MKRILIFSSILLLFTACSSTLTTVKDPTLQANKYRRILLVTDTYQTNKKGFKKWFDENINNFEAISRINTRLIHLTQDKLKTNNVSIDTYFVKNSLDDELVLNGGNPEDAVQQQIANRVLEKNIDLVITIYPKDIRRIYNNTINGGVGISTGGNPNIGLQASTNSSNLKYTYIFTAIDTKTQLEVWKGRYEINNADNFLTNIPKCVANKLVQKINEDQLLYTPLSY